MSQHISYTSRREEPVYIGFDEPRASDQGPGSPTNALGAFSLFFGVLGVLSSGVAFSAILAFLSSQDVIEAPSFGVRVLVPLAGMGFSAIALLFAFFGMFKRPRKHALAGGLLALVPIAGFVGLEQYVENAVYQRDMQFQLRLERQATDQKIDQAIQSILGFENKKGRLPDGLEGNRLAIQVQDSWEKELRYEPLPKGFNVRSAGPDGQFDTDDDRVRMTRVQTVYTTSD